MDAASYVRLTSDGVALTGPGKLWGVLVANGAGGYVVIYDGVNARGRRLFSTRLTTGITETVPAMFPSPIPVEQGIFVDSGGTTMEDILVIFEPLPPRGPHM